MTRLAPISARELQTILSRLGFRLVRQKGSHAILRRQTAEGARGCVVPMHQEVQPGTLRGILKQAGIRLEDFIAKL